VREPDGSGYGNLTPLARKALEPRLERIQTALRVREQLQETAGTAEDWRNTALAGERAQFNTALRAAAGPWEDLPGSPRSADQAALAPRERSYDGERLRDVQIELRALRAEIFQLSRALGRPALDSNRIEYKGVLQLRDELESDVRLMRWRSEDSQLQGQIRVEMRRMEGERINARQRDLLRALQRAERNLSEAPDKLPPGLRESLIGDILRARHDIALFGGAAGVMLSGMEFSVAA
jgi:hypothetical protein